MALRKLTDATVEPVTLAEAKAHLNIQTADHDAYLPSLITAARTAAEGKLNRSLIDTSWELTLDAFPSAIPLRMAPVISVASVKYIDTAGTQQTLAAPSYLVDDRSEPGWIVPAYGYQWPTVRDQINAVTVVYHAGYGSDATKVPEPIKWWIKAQLAAMFANRSAVEVDRGIVVVELGFVDHLLDPYLLVEL